MIYLLLYWEFFKIGLFAVGGGLATIPFLYRLSYKTGWFTTLDIANMFAISEITPGPLGVNMATFAGYSSAGIGGAVTATLGIVTPSIIIIVLIAGLLKNSMENKYIKAAFRGVQAAVCALISAAVLDIITASLFNIDLYKATAQIADLFSIKALLFFAILLIMIRKLKIHPFAYICVSAAIGFFIQF
jgi:chromate transporter